MIRYLLSATRSHFFGEGQCLHSKTPFVVNLHGKFCLSLCTGMTRTMNPQAGIENSNPTFARPELPLHRQHQSYPAEDRSDGGYDRKRPGAKHMERIAGTSRGKSQDQEPLAEPGQRARPGCYCLRWSPLFTVNPPAHIALRAYYHSYMLVGLRADVSPFQSVGTEFLPASR